VNFTTPGFYTVTLNATNSYGGDFETKASYIEVTDSHTNLNEDDLSRVEIYPNPTSGQVLVNLNNVSTVIEEIEVRDVTGRIIMVRKSPTGNTLFELGNETDGIYFINVKSSKSIITKKVVKI